MSHRFRGLHSPWTPLPLITHLASIRPLFSPPRPLFLPLDFPTAVSQTNRSSPLLLLSGSPGYPRHTPSSLNLYHPDPLSSPAAPLHLCPALSEVDSTFRRAPLLSHYPIGPRGPTARDGGRGSGVRPAPCLWPGEGVASGDPAPIRAGPRWPALRRWAALPRLCSTPAQAPAAAPVGVGGGADSGCGSGCGSRLSERRASREKRRKWSRGCELWSQLPRRGPPHFAERAESGPRKTSLPGSSRRGSASSRPRPALPRQPQPGSALRGPGRVAGTPQTPDPDPVHQGGTLLAHHTALGLPAPSQPFSSVCRSP